jgi:hypothetical protein
LQNLQRLVELARAALEKAERELIHAQQRAKKLEDGNKVCCCCCCCYILFMFIVVDDVVDDDDDVVVDVVSPLLPLLRMVKRC